jgi:hypothetical protein
MAKTPAAKKAYDAKADAVYQKMELHAHWADAHNEMIKKLSPKIKRAEPEDIS